VELSAVAGAIDGLALAQLLGVTLGGNFEGRSILTRRADPRQIAQLLGRELHEIARLLAHWREALLEYRSKRTPPALDRKIVTAWNGMAIAALAQAYMTGSNLDYLQAAQEAARYLWEHHRQPDGGLWRASTDGARSGVGSLSDYAQFALGLLELYCASGDTTHLKRALALLDYALPRFARPEGGYFISPADAEAPLGRQADMFDSVEPSGSAALLHALWRAAALTGRKDYRSEVLRQLEACAGLLRQGGLELSAWCELAQDVLGPFYTVVLAGSADDAGTQALRSQYSALLPRHSVLIQVRAEGADADTVALLPEADGKTALNDIPTAYVCEHGTCYPPCTTPEELHAAVMKGWVGKREDQPGTGDPHAADLNR